MMLKMLIANWLQEQAKGQIESVRESLERMPERTKSGPPVPCEIVILFGSAVEAGGTIDQLKDRVAMQCSSHIEYSGNLDSVRVGIVETGVGQLAAATAAVEAVKFHKPRWLICAGFASALRPEMKRGHVLMAKEVIDASSNRISLPLHLDARSLVNNPALHIGRLLTVDHLVRSPDERRELATTHDAQACDLDSWGAAEACRQANVRCLAVRIMTETVDDQLPADVETMLHQKTAAAKLGAAAGSVWRRPSVAKDLWRCNEDALKASDRLARFLSGLVKNLPA
jgi:adenosylhomocysteine nucleosidase